MARQLGEDATRTELSRTSAADVKTIASGATAGTSAKLVGRALQVLTQVVLARTLGPAAFGAYAVGWTLLRFATILTPLGLDRAVLRFATSEETPERIRGVVWDSLAIVIVTSSMAAITTALIAPLAAARLFHNPAMTSVLRWFGLGAMLAACQRLLVAVSWTTRRVRYGILTEDLLQPTCNLLLVVLAYRLGLGITGAIWAAVISFGVGVSMAVFFLIRRLGPLLRPGLGMVHRPKVLLSFSVPAALAAALPVFITWTDRFAVAMLRPASEMGVYQVVSQASVMFAVIMSGIGGSILAPMMASLHERKELHILEELFRVTTKWGLYASIPPFLVFFLMPGQFLTTVFGTAYLAGKVPLLIIAFAGLANAATGPVGILLIMTGKERVWFAIALGALALDLVLQFTLTPRFGLTGAATATTIATSFMFLTGLLTAVRHQFWPYDRRYWKGLLGALAAGVALEVIKGLGIRRPALELGLGCFLAVGVFVIILGLLGLEPEDQHVFTAVRRLPSRIFG